jgi:hypothetical protein
MDKINLLTKYESNQFIRPLINLIPFGIGSGIDSFLMVTLNRMRQNRAEIFFDRLSNGVISVDDNYLKSDEFVHKYIITMKYVLDTQQKEKIEMFANIFKNSLNAENRIVNVNIYEDFSGILNDLSYRELCALSIFESFYMKRKKNEHENELGFVFGFWNEFEEKMENELAVSKASVENYMIKISRTGCYKEITGGYLDYTGGKGILTPLYFELKDYILAN